MIGLFPQVPYKIIMTAKSLQQMQLQQYYDDPFESPFEFPLRNGWTCADYKWLKLMDSVAEKGSCARRL